MVTVTSMEDNGKSSTAVVTGRSPEEQPRDGDIFRWPFTHTLTLWALPVQKSTFKPTTLKSRSMYFKSLSSEMWGWAELKADDGHGEAAPPSGHHVFSKPPSHRPLRTLCLSSLNSYVIKTRIHLHIKSLFGETCASIVLSLSFRWTD